MKEILVAELEQMVPALIEQIAGGVEEQFNVKKMITEKVNEISMKDFESLFYQYAGKNILALKISVAALGLLLGGIEIWLMKL
jgi:uncharacterized membrane protein YheB (UPF0754 family)